MSLGRFRRLGAAWVMLAAVLAFAPPAVGADTPPLSTVAPAQWLPGYDAVRLALVADDEAAAIASAQALATSAGGDTEIAAAAGKVATATDTAARRAAFADLSRVVLLRLSNPGSPRVLAYHCPMYAGFAYWVQPKAGIANPYMGRAMPECGEEVSLRAAVKAAEAPR